MHRGLPDGRDATAGGTIPVELAETLRLAMVLPAPTSDGDAPASEGLIGIGGGAGGAFRGRGRSRLRPEELGSVVVRVRRSDGSKAARVQVSLGGSVRRTDEDGTVRFDGLRAGARSAPHASALNVAAVPVPCQRSAP